MSVSVAQLSKFQFNWNDAPIVGGLLFTYAAGTTTKLTTYQDSFGAVPNTNPIVLDANGQCNLYLTDQLSYKFTLSPPGDTDPPTNPYWTVDNILSAADAAITLTLGALTPTTIAPTGLITPASASGIAGNTTGNNAAAGSVGAILTATGTAVSLTSGTPVNIISITLPAGDWDVTGSISFNPAATTIITTAAGAVNNTSATFPAVPLYSQNYTSAAANEPLGFALPTRQFNVTTNTTVYLVGNSVFTTSTCTATATIRARRMQ